MQISWGEDHDVLADVSRSVFVRYSPLEDRDNHVPFAEQLAQFAELGWLQLSDPTGLDQDCPGLGTIAAVFVEAGRALAATPLLELVAARDALLLAGSPRALELAEQAGEGALSVIPVFDEPTWGATLTVREGRLEGVAMAVGHALDAEVLLVHADGDESVLAAVDPSMVTVEAMPNIGGHPLHSITFDAVDLSGCEVLATGDTALRAASVAQERAAVLRAAQVVGAGQKLLDMTVLYAQQRHQFGGPVGRFQAVQYLCTDIAITAHLTSVHVRSTAAAMDAGEPVQPHLGLLRSQAAEAAQHMVHAAHEVHAGIGFMVESDVHLFTNAAKRWQFDFGTPTVNSAAVVDALTARTDGVAS